MTYKFTLDDVLEPDPDSNRVTPTDTFHDTLAAHFGERVSAEDLAWIVSLYKQDLLASINAFARSLKGIDGPAPTTCRFFVQELLDEISSRAIQRDEVDFAVKQLHIAAAELENPDLRADPPEPADFAL